MSSNDDGTRRSSSGMISMKVCIAANKFVSLLKKKARAKNIYQRAEKVDENYQPPSYSYTEDDQKLILDALEKNFFLRNRTRDELKRLSESFERCSHKKEERFIKQGDVGDFFYILKSGGVRFVVDGKIVSQACHAGVSFGELSLLFTSPRAASVIATEDSTFFRVGQTDFRTIMQRQTEAAVEEKFKLLEGIPFLKEARKQDLKKFARVMTPFLFGPNKLLEKKGQAGTQFWIIQQGKVKMSNVEIGSTKYEDQILVPGDHFGSRALALDEPREADFTSITAGVAFTIDRSTFEKVLGSMSALVVKANDARLLGGIEFFREAKLDAPQLAVLANLITHKAFHKDELILNKGTKTKPAIYIVRKGEVEVESSTGEKRVVKAGGFFGNELMNTAQGQIRSKIESPTTARVKDTCVCGVLTLKDCRTLFDDEEDDEEEEVVVEVEEVLSKKPLPDAAAKPKKKKREKSLKFVPPVLPASVEGLKRHVVLGEGTFGQVWLVTSKETPSGEKPRPMALKIQSKYHLIEEGQAEASLREKKLLEELQHPFIIKLFKAYQDDDFVYCVLDFLQGGELFSVVQAQEKNDYKMSESMTKFYALGIADALSFMHRSRIAYRDLKTENVMIDEQGYPVLVDLGFAKKIGFDKTYVLRSLLWIGDALLLYIFSNS